MTDRHGCLTCRAEIPPRWKFCSADCKKSAPPREAPCKQCGKPRKVNGATGKLCSACRNSNYRARYQSDSEWRKRRIKSSERSKESSNRASRRYRGTPEGQAKRRAYRKRPEVSERISVSNTRNAKHWNDISRDHASRHYQEWTGPELELAARQDVSIKDVAAATGRTLAAVKAARRKLKTNPREQKLAGLIS